ncbi:hypothetical protein [Limosilactobacillus sp.]|jgi:glucan-binding YG repeat protein|uniref:hypothetical protein n=1 Tax=Limosilactobacillus sp. TaxID=2773925 RepID=UPI0025BABE9F|nr:hypothetical protein [Limosilactobacillus sp.]MCH3922238.1 hypothetical protein [Limosilactobacillus sp.]MCH3929010.1 hypothetical protein [Limosilactobacillus sp.]
MRLHKGWLVSLSVLAGITLGSASLANAHADDNGAASVSTSQVVTNATTTQDTTTATANDSNANQAATNQAATNDEAATTTTDQQATASDQSNVTVSTPKASTNGWVQNEYGFWQYLQNGTPISDGWQMIDGQWYFFSGTYMAANGECATSFSDNTKEFLNSYYYFDANGHYLTNGWINIKDGYWTYARPDGRLVTGWQKINGSWYFFINLKGGPAMAFNQIHGDQKGNYYSFDANGHYQTNQWVKSDLDGSWHYAQANGILATGWQKINGRWYYFVNSEDYQLVDGTYAGNGPAAATGWQKINNRWYYFDPTNAWGDTGWQYLNGNWYYFDWNNAWAETGWQWINGHWYYFDNNNAWALKGWQKINGSWYYFDPTNAWMVTGTQTINGKTYTFNSDGQLQE